VTHSARAVIGNDDSIKTMPRRQIRVLGVDEPFEQ
jgi:hypothetical protein